MASFAQAADIYVYNGQGDHASDRVALVVSKWHPEITERLYLGAIEVLRAYGVEYTLRQDVPGSLELPLAARLLADTRRFDAIILLGCVIKGETRHDEFINHAIMQSALRISMKHKIPVMLGVLTTENVAQAWERAGGNAGHKGKECAIGALEMIDLVRATADL